MGFGRTKKQFFGVWNGDTFIVAFVIEGDDNRTATHAREHCLIAAKPPADIIADVVMLRRKIGSRVEANAAAVPFPHITDRDRDVVHQSVRQADVRFRSPVHWDMPSSNLTTTSHHAGSIENDGT
jgi:hypothetical protein